MGTAWLATDTPPWGSVKRKRNSTRSGLANHGRANGIRTHDTAPFGGRSGVPGSSLPCSTRVM
jgi:hypothetical protein